MAEWLAWTLIIAGSYIVAGILCVMGAVMLGEDPDDDNRMMTIFCLWPFVIALGLVWVISVIASEGGRSIRRWRKRRGSQ